MAHYAWIIDIDHLADADAPLGTYQNAPGVTGPRTAPDGLLARLAKGEGRKWKIYDDDRELCYEGRIVFMDPTDEQGDGLSLPEKAFGPLWDFGEGNVGATEIHYFINGRWTQL